MIVHLDAVAEPLQVGVASRRPAAASARDAGLTEFAAESAKSAEAAAQERNDCSDDGRKSDYSKHAGKDDYSKEGKGDCSRRDGAWKDAGNGDCQLDKHGCEPQKNCCGTKSSSDCGNGDTNRNPGEALAKIDFSRW
jgi:ATP-binding cassette, subfamily B, bacterial CvaB/MchF/RaxB